MKYKSNNQIVQAIKYEANSEKVLDEIQDDIADFANLDIEVFEASNDVLIVADHGDLLLKEGEWLIKTESGMLKKCKPDIFEKTYERVEG